ncbi:hypothetical protein TSTA_054370 [Talaromyces stipitatus ATCC 10500]|uniref:Uncharacterized protein n=1 Tax=Talaromyces stipitatus (strain ATCC 10500 / CBS 375.48 / QM 6759 / NRRL 1006) TaxID=441959 RepID=B8MR31_TALSN|nr:uncharacterized protein TSTA_054370 [Talaromyces stipitatus ATCC 10500]EED12926.1 hypothetical protein TSTA_054370 [Talaromyces stipitatus ATCC 10500]
MPSAYVPGFRVIQQLFREVKRETATESRENRIKTIKTPASIDPFARTERQLYLLKGNVERLLNYHLTTQGDSSVSRIEEIYPEDEEE